MASINTLLDKELDYQRQQYINSESRAYRFAAGLGIAMTIVLSSMAFVARSGVDMPASVVHVVFLLLAATLTCLGIILSLLAMLPHPSTTESRRPIQNSISILRTEQQCHKLLLAANSDRMAHEACETACNLIFGISSFEAEDAQSLESRAKLGRILMFKASLSIRMIFLQLALYCIFVSIIFVLASGMAIVFGL